MSNNKDVHRTGALAAVLSQGLVRPASNKLDSISKQNKPPYSDTIPTPTVEENGATLLQVSADDCIPWKFADRSFFEMGDIKSLAESIAQSGQQEPGLVRPTQDKSQPYKYEIIFGNRRWQACKLISSKFLVILKNINDQDAALYQKEENSHRKEISDYSKAIYYKKLLDEGIFESEAELSRKLGIARSRINDLLAYTRVPEILRNRISNFHKLPQCMVIKLASLTKNDEYLQILLNLAERIEKKQINHNNIENIIKNNHPIRESLKPSENLPPSLSIEKMEDGAKRIILDKKYANLLPDSEIVSILNNYIFKILGVN